MTAPTKLIEVLKFPDRPGRTGAGYARYGSGLTPRELDVLELKCEGLTNKAIAHELGVSEQTVKNHVTAALTRTGAPNSVALAARYQRFISEGGKPLTIKARTQMEQLEERIIALEQTVEPMKSLLEAIRRADLPGTDTEG